MLPRFHLDENVSITVAAGLRRRNIDVTTVAELRLTGADDITQLNFAFTERRVLVTHDADFLRMHAEGARHADIAYCRQGGLAIREILRRLVLIYDLLSAEEMSDRIEFL